MHIILLAAVPFILLVASWITIDRWRLSKVRKRVIVGLSMVAGIAGVFGGFAYWSPPPAGGGDPSAGLIELLFGLAITGPIAALLVFWASILFSSVFSSD